MMGSSSWSTPPPAFGSVMGSSSSLFSTPTSGAAMGSSPSLFCFTPASGAATGSSPYSFGVMPASGAAMGPSSSPFGSMPVATGFSPSSGFTPYAGPAMRSSFGSMPVATGFIPSSFGFTPSSGAAMDSSSSWCGPAFGRSPNAFGHPMPHQAPFSSNTPFSSTTGQHYSHVPTFGVQSEPSFGPFGPMPVFKSKSHEELRCEDYKKGDKGGLNLQEGRVPWAYHSSQPQPQAPVNAFANPVKPSLFSYSPEPSSAPVGLQSSAHGTTNPFWLRAPAPQSPLFSYPPEPIHKPSWFSSSFAPSTTCWENVSNNTAAYTAPADTSSAQGHMFSQNLFPSKSTQSGGSLLSSSVAHSAPAPSPNGHSTTINIDQAEKTVELLLPVDITTVRIRFSPKNDDTGSRATEVHHNVKASATPVSFCIYPGENQELTIQSVEQHDRKPSSSTGSAGEHKGYINGPVLARSKPFDPVITPFGGAPVSESVLPRLYKADYYTLPSIAELAARESNEPGCCSHVKDFTVGRHGYGSIKFDGETDVRKLDIASIVEFKDREILVYTDESKRPPVGQELNKPAEITLLNVKCVDKKTGLQLTEGQEVDRYEEILAQWTEKNGAEFMAFDAVKGEWKFRIKHF
uniref:Peptidase S59 domain-containing protein n=1 Tax=Aegilops tauschii subsp. strangulata TaxID=200361 RepID=A0A452XU05_AEGTS